MKPNLIPRIIVCCLAMIAAAIGQSTIQGKVPVEQSDLYQMTWDKLIKYVSTHSDGGDEVEQTKRLHELEAITADLSTVENFSKMALACHEKVLDQGLNDFYQAQWRCIWAIAKIPGEEAANELKRLKPILGPDGGESLQLGHAIEHQSEVRHQKSK